MSVLHTLTRSLPILLLASTAHAAEIDLQLTTTLPGVHAVKVEVVPVESGPRATLSILKPTDVEAEGKEKVEGFFAPLVDAVSGVYRYFLDVTLFDDSGQVLNRDDDDDDDDTSPIVDIFIDGDCDDCGDYDFTVPTPTGSQPATIDGRLDLLDPNGDVSIKLSTSGNNAANPAAYAEIEILGSRDPNAPKVLEPFVVVPLDKVTTEFDGDLVFKEGNPANLPYEIKVSWLGAGGVQIGNVEVFEATAVVSKTRRDGTAIYKPWRLKSDVAAVVGETWTLSAASDTFVDAVAFDYALVPLDGGPKFASETHHVKAPSSYQQRARATDVKAAGVLAEGQTWTFLARLLDADGLPVGKDILITGAPQLDDEREAGVDACHDKLDCVPSVRVRYAGRGADPSNLVVSTPNFDVTRTAATLVLTLLPERSTGPMLAQEGLPEGSLELPIDVSRVLFESDLSLVFPSGLASDAAFTYEATLTWLDSSATPVGVEGATFVLRRKGGGWTWVAITHEASVKIK
jgi:hypothetical protein